MWRELVGQTDETLQQGTIIGDKLVLSYLKDAASRALILDLRGKGAKVLSLNGLGTAAGFKGKPGDPETFYSYTSFNQPTAIYRMDLASGATRPFARPALTFNPDRFRGRSALLHLERRHQSADVHRPQEGHRGGGHPGADLALWLWRLRCVADPGLFLGADGLAGGGRGLCSRQPARRRRIWQGLARCRAA